MATARCLRTPAWLLVAIVVTVVNACSRTTTEQAAGGPAPAAAAPAESSGQVDSSGRQTASRNQAGTNKAETTMNLPRKVGAWTRPEVPRTVTAAQIFDYMDGAGELYLGYRFDHLDVYDYPSPATGNILVELYWMKTSDDAFGLLSNDWGGEGVNLAADWGRAPRAAGAPPHRALYGAGLLRVWSDRLYARVLASNDTPVSRQAVLDIGRAVVAGQPVARPPAILAALPRQAAPGLSLRQDRVWFLRSHLVLNAAYFLATDNILDLDLSTQAVVAPYGSSPPVPEQKSSQLILVRYATADAARRALAHFRRGYLPESANGAAASDSTSSAFTRIEDGWVGHRASDRTLVLVFECQSRQHAASLIDEVVRNLGKLEVSGDG